MVFLLPVRTTLRERLQKKFSHLALQIANNEVRQRNRAAGLAPANKEILRQLMKCYASAELPARMRTAYEQCFQAIVKSSGSAPSRRTRELYNALLDS